MNRNIVTGCIDGMSVLDFIDEALSNDVFIQFSRDKGITKIIFFSDLKSMKLSTSFSAEEIESMKASGDPDKFLVSILSSMARQWVLETGELEGILDGDR